MCSKPCQEMQNLDAMHRSVLQVLSTRTEFNNEKDAQIFYDTACQYLSSILLAKYRRNSSCPLMSETK